jgi:VIT1/CCC1 family predicted Fe2+/Mn2+ transporter
VSQLAQLPRPKLSQLKELQNWLRNDDGGADFLKRAEFDTWEEEDVNEYVAVRDPGGEGDFITGFVVRLLAAFHRFFGYQMRMGREIDKRTGLTSYSDTNISYTSNLFAAALSSALPVLTIFVLNALQSTTLRLGVTVVFTSIFALILASFSSARKAEILTATAS